MTSKNKVAWALRTQRGWIPAFAGMFLGVCFWFSFCAFGGGGSAHWILGKFAAQIFQNDGEEKSWALRTQERCRLLPV
jgi:hypothetical protein